MLLPRIVLTAVVVGSILASCGTSYGPTTGDEPSAAGTMDSGQVCAGTCVPQAQSGWQGPALLWSGPKEKAPSCPAYAPKVLYQGNADPVAPNECATCTCGPPTGSCALPSKITGYKSEKSCQESPDVFPFDPPPEWDGSCSANTLIPANTVNTLVIGPARLTETGCSPGTVVPEVTAPPPSWQTYALACYGQGPQCKKGDFCLSTADPIPDGFGLCIFHEGVELCPEAYPHQHVFYEGISDERACSPCECGPPVGSKCLGQIIIYQDSACTELFWGTNLSLTDLTTCTLSDKPYPLPFPLPFGSKSGKPPIYLPGSCAAMGGEPIGAAIAMGPSTLCCRD